MHVFYLHGFASSPRSSKAAYFRERFATFGIALRCPDFNVPDFSSLTLTRMLERVAGEIAPLDDQPIVLVGSSLGGVAAIYTAAALGRRIARLILLAPALRFPRDADTVLGPGRLDQWERSGTLDVLHQSDGVVRGLAYGFYEDGMKYDAASVDLTQPTSVFQGVRDTAVDPRIVAEWAARHPNVDLTLLDDDHQLHTSLPAIWKGMASFLGLSE